MYSSKMTATRSNRKRSHADVDDADECLPISKRINSLHLEAQSHGCNSQEVSELNVSPFANFCDSVNTSSLPLPGNISFHHGIQQSDDGACRLERNSAISLSVRSPATDEHSDNMQTPVNSRHMTTSQYMHFSQSLSDPNPMYSAHFLPTHTQINLGQHPEEMGHALTTTFYQQPHGSLIHSSSSDPSVRSAHCCSSLAPHLNSTLHSVSLLQNKISVEENVNTHSPPLESFQSLTTSSNLPFQNNQGDQLSSFFVGHSEQFSEFERAVLYGQQQQQQFSPFQPQPETMTDSNQDFDLRQLPSGRYDPELSVDENPYYFSVNQMLYEAHLARVRREYRFNDSL